MADDELDMAIALSASTKQRDDDYDLAFEVEVELTRAMSLCDLDAISNESDNNERAGLETILPDSPRMFINGPLTPTLMRDLQLSPPQQADELPPDIQEDIQPNLPAELEIQLLQSDNEGADQETIIPDSSQMFINGPLTQTLMRDLQLSPSQHTHESTLNLQENLQPSPMQSHIYVDGECTICFEEFSNLLLQILPCAHKFHDHCVARWLQENDSCPVCRISTTDPPEPGIIPEPCRRTFNCIIL